MNLFIYCLPSMFNLSISVGIVLDYELVLKNHIVSPIGSIFL